MVAGVPTTRALSLVVSRTEKSRRPWYSNKTAEFNDRTADLSHTPPAPPDIVQMEPCAITARVSSSFLRVGHFELYARRARGDRGAALVDTGYARLTTSSRLWSSFALPRNEDAHASY
eukprot:COSAG02_NODE_15806_length_1139_cov_1.630769_2_plen_117_part_01